jgi:hypothetical protein
MGQAGEQIIIVDSQENKEDGNRSIGSLSCNAGDI